MYIFGNSLQNTLVQMSLRYYNVLKFESLCSNTSTNIQLYAMKMESNFRNEIREIVKRLWINYDSKMCAHTKYKVRGNFDK